MGNMPYCSCIEKRKSISINSDIIIKKYYNSNLTRKEKLGKYESNKILDSEIDKNTFSPQHYFINPLPNIVIIKHKNFLNIK